MPDLAPFAPFATAAAMFGSAFVGFAGGRLNLRGKREELGLQGLTNLVTALQAEVQRLNAENVALRARLAEVEALVRGKAA